MDKTEFVKDFIEFNSEMKKSSSDLETGDITMLYAVYRKDLRANNLNNNGFKSDPTEQMATEKQKRYLLNLAKAKAVEKKAVALVGPAAFYIGLLIAVVAAFITQSGLLYVGLAVLGVIVGLLNITAKEIGPFLFASIAFIVAALGMGVLVSSMIPATIAQYPEFLRLATNLVVFIGAGAMLISLRAIYEVAKSK